MGHGERPGGSASGITFASVVLPALITLVAASQLERRLGKKPRSLHWTLRGWLTQLTVFLIWESSSEQPAQSVGRISMVGSLMRGYQTRGLPLWLAVAGSFMLLCLGQFELVTGWQGLMHLNIGAVGLIACLALSELRRRRGELEILRLRAVATTDPLTGAGNRRSFDQEVNRRIAIFRRYQSPSSLLVIDADHFKLVNDTWGHDIGDLVLQSMVRTIQATLRDIDQLFRLGGEEFVAVLPETDGANAEIAAERIRRAIDELRIPVEGQLFQVTVSLGGAELLPSDDLATWVKRGDEALYQAKKSGRNQVVFARKPGQPANQLPRQRQLAETER